MRRFLALGALLMAFSMYDRAQAESYIDQEIDQVLRRVSKLPLVSASGRVQLNASFRGALVGDLQWANGCRFTISDFQGGSLVGYTPRKMKARGLVTSPCLGSEPLRVFIDVEFDMQSRRVALAHIYARRGTTNHLLAVCGKAATLSTAARSCE